MNIDPLVEAARTKRIPPKPSREKGQRSLSPSAPFLFRYPSTQHQPDWIGSERWRAFVQAQPFAVDCREAIINYILSLDWKIVPRDSTKMDELKGEIDYYTQFLENTGKYEFADIIEWLLKDFLDIPFGGVSEVGREGDAPEGRVLWIELLDGGTCFPTNNVAYPVGQSIPSANQQPVFFPAHAINRLFMSPRTEYKRSGWGMAPPEKIYLAIDLMTRGDKYYVNLLSDTPEAGLLDLMNMSKTSAEEWIEAFRTYMAGTDPFKIPVLYEHDQKAEWIPFGKPPTDIMYDRTIAKYAAITCGGYGVTFSDIGFPGATSGGDSLAGSIRQERTSKRSGKAKAKKRLASWFNRLIDPSQKKLKFEWIDMDDELLVAIGRARLANATALGQLIDKNVISYKEARLQTLSDGTFTITLPEEPPQEIKERIENQNAFMQSPERPGMLGKPVAPSQGGYGEVTEKSEFENRLHQLVNTDKLHLQRLAQAALPSLSTGVDSAMDQLMPDEMGIWANWQNQIIWGDITEEIPELTSTVLELSSERVSDVMTGDWWNIFAETDNVVDEVLDILIGAYKEQTYITGKSKSIDECIIPDEQIEGMRKVLQIKLSDFDMKANVCRAVQAGITNYLSQSVQKLDETLKIDDNLISEIRSQLRLLSDRLILDFGKTIQNLMESKDEV